MFIRKTFMLVLMLMLMLGNLYAGNFKKVASVKPVLVQEGSLKKWCPVCGMNLKMFYKTNHASKLKNGTPRQYCSLRCLAVDMKEYKINIDDIQVVDASTQKLISVKDAFYVMGSKIKGTMSKVSKLAFADEKEAKNFIKKYKGKIVSFDTALEMANKSLNSDIAMITKKKKKKVYPMGKKIYQKMCNHDIDPLDYIEINELKAMIVKNKLCKPLKEKQLQAVALYIWEVKRVSNHNHNEQSVKVNKEEKCPVCGMFVYKYPRWAAQVFYKKDSVEAHYSFDGVKDLMKFYFNPKEWGNFEVKDKGDITKILVTDYYTQKGIDAKKAYFVIGSDVYGPMGDELIPFENEDDAKTFMIDHKGKSLLKFDEITSVGVYKLDE